jgi:hypothetical protein
MLLADPKQPPIIISEYVEPVFDGEGNHVWGGRVCDSKTANVNGTIMRRMAAETLDDFKARCCASLPARRGGVITMRGDA